MWSPPIWLKKGLVCAAALVMIATSCKAGEDSGYIPPSGQGDCAAGVTPSVNWSGCDKHGVNLANRLFQGADFSGADLSGADLSGTQLVSVQMKNTNLTDATMLNATVSGGFPQGAKLCRTTMPGGEVNSKDC